jgi:D-sedoheptulose 7-phosphate isomerase
MLTALGNDISYDAVFSQQLKYYLGKDDALLLVSSSGNSPNVVKACEYANSCGVPTIAFVGFKGGRLRDIARHSVWIPIENYGMAEDAHQSLMHVTTQYIMAYSQQRIAAEAQCD